MFANRQQIKKHFWLFFTIVNLVHNYFVGQLNEWPNRKCVRRSSAQNTKKRKLRKLNQWWKRKKKPDLQLERQSQQQQFFSIPLSLSSRRQIHSNRLETIKSRENAAECARWINTRCTTQKCDYRSGARSSSPQRH